MPFYEYECSSCKFYVEALQKISDPPMVKCPSCGKETMQRLVSAPNFRLKGGGWYETDFKSDKEAKRNIAGAEDKPVESKDGEESKPVKKPRKVVSPSKKGGKASGKVASKPSAKTRSKKAKKSPGKSSGKPKAKVVKKAAVKKAAAKKAAKKKAAKKK
jgi:putative FmdB family regulatory protein